MTDVPAELAGEPGAAQAPARRPAVTSIQSPFDEFVSRHGCSPRRGLFGLLVHDIGRRIIGGEFREGGPLPNEDELIQRFAASRTTVREVMKTLASKGLIEIKTKTGTRVRNRSHWHHTDPDVMVWNYETGPSQEFLDALVDLRRVLEPAAAARAAQRATDQEIATIARAYEAMCSTIGDPKAHSDADGAFHAAIFIASHNMILARLIDLIAIGIYGNAVLAPARVVSGQKRSLSYHEAVLTAIQVRDPIAAAAACDRLHGTWFPEAERVRRAQS